MTETARRRTRRTRAQLDQQVILATATELAASGTPITFRALGSALGADPTAVYRHFRDKDELVRAVFDRMLAELVEQVDGSATWREQLREGATLMWDLCERHPSIGVEALSVTTGGQGELAAIELMVSQFRRSGLDQAQAVRYYAVYTSYVLAVGASIAASRQKRAGGATLDPRWIGDLGFVDPQRFPSVAAARGELADLRDRDIFEMGLEVLLDGAEATAARSVTPR